MKTFSKYAMLTVFLCLILSHHSIYVVSAEETPTSLPSSSSPSGVPSRQPSSEPSISPSSQPSIEPSQHPSIPSSQPSSAPTSIPSLKPTPLPTKSPTPNPSLRPTPVPSGPTRKPTPQPTPRPSRRPTSNPTGSPSTQPSRGPTAQPSTQPTLNPTCPSSQPSRQPSGQPSAEPSSQPSSQPSLNPTCPSSHPSVRPSSLPSSRPTTPSGQPSRQPSVSPSEQPSSMPSAFPSSNPTNPTGMPTSQPQSMPSLQPSSEPSGQPSSEPSGTPSQLPSGQPTRQPSAQPTTIPSAVTIVESKFNISQVLEGCSADDFIEDKKARKAFILTASNCLGLRVDSITILQVAPARKRRLSNQESSLQSDKVMNRLGEAKGMYDASGIKIDHLRQQDQSDKDDQSVVGPGWIHTDGPKSLAATGATLTYSAQFIHSQLGFETVNAAFDHLTWKLLGNVESGAFNEILRGQLSSQNLTDLAASVSSSVEGVSYTKPRSSVSKGDYPTSSPTSIPTSRPTQANHKHAITLYTPVIKGIIAVSVMMVFLYLCSVGIYFCLRYRAEQMAFKLSQQFSRNFAEREKKNLAREEIFIDTDCIDYAASKEQYQLGIRRKSRIEESKDASATQVNGEPKSFPTDLEKHVNYRERPHEPLELSMEILSIPFTYGFDKKKYKSLSEAMEKNGELRKDGKKSMNSPTAGDGEEEGVAPAVTLAGGKTASQLPGRAVATLVPLAPSNHQSPYILPAVKHGGENIGGSEKTILKKLVSVVMSTADKPLSGPSQWEIGT